MGGCKWHKTEFPGVRFYRHDARKHGVKFDQYFSIRYQQAGNRKEEGCGWASKGWTAKKAALLLAELKEAARTGKGEARLSERRNKRASALKKEARERVTFSKFWEGTYFPHAKGAKTFKAHDRERGLFENWIKPVMGALHFRDIAPIHLEKLKKNMADAGKAPRSIQYALAVVRQVFNDARRHGVFAGENPSRRVKCPRVDNRRLRFLTKPEADALLGLLQKTDRTAYEMALLSLHSGLRAGEIFKLTWADIDIDRGLIAIKDSKSGRSRFAHTTDAVKDMLLGKDIGAPGNRLFPLPDGSIRREVPRVFEDAVKTLGLNEGREDRRDRLVFHSLRHTFASWLVQNGVDLFRVKTLLGHSVIQMTERYAHLAPENARQAMKVLDALLKEPEPEATDLPKVVSAG